MRRTSTSLKSSMNPLLYKPELMIGITATEVGNFNAIRVIGSQNAGAKCWHSTAKCKVSTVIIIDNRAKAQIRIVWLV